MRAQSFCALMCITRLAYIHQWPFFSYCCDAASSFLFFSSYSLKPFPFHPRCSNRLLDNSAVISRTPGVFSVQVHREASNFLLVDSNNKMWTFSLICNHTRILYIVRGTADRHVRGGWGEGGGEKVVTCWIRENMMDTCWESEEARKWMISFDCVIENRIFWQAYIFSICANLEINFHQSKV